MISLKKRTNFLIRSQIPLVEDEERESYHSRSPIRRTESQEDRKRVEQSQRETQRQENQSDSNLPPLCPYCPQLIHQTQNSHCPLANSYPHIDNLGNLIGLKCILKDNSMFYVDFTGSDPRPIRSTPSVPYSLTISPTPEPPNYPLPFHRPLSLYFSNNFPFHSQSILSDFNRQPENGNRS